MHYCPPQSNFRGGRVPRVPRGIYATADTVRTMSIESEYIKLTLNFWKFIFILNYIQLSANANFCDKECDSINFSPARKIDSITFLGIVDTSE